MGIVYRLEKNYVGYKSNNNFMANISSTAFYIADSSHFQCIVSFIAMKNRIPISDVNTVTFEIVSPCEGLISTTKNQFSRIQLDERYTKNMSFFMQQIKIDYVILELC